MAILVLLMFIGFIVWTAFFGVYDADGSIQAGHRARRKRHRDGGIRRS